MGLFGNLLGNVLGGGGKPTVPDWQNITLADQQLKAIDANAAALPKAEGLVGEANRFSQDQIRKMLEMAIPNFSEISGSASKNIAALMRGEVPADVSGNVQRNSAAQALGGGYAGSGMARNLTTRDLGLTSLQAIQGGLSAAESWIANMDRLYAPGTMDVSSMFVTPMQMFGATMSNQESEWGVQWLKNQVEAMPDPFGQALGQFLGGIGDAAASMYVGSAATQGQAGGGSFNGGQMMGGGAGNTTVQGGGDPNYWIGNYNMGGASAGAGSAGAGAGGAAGGAGGAGGMCCFIFLEAHNGTLPWWVRVCRDYYYERNPRIATGYKRMAKWLVPMMKKSKIVRGLVNRLMVTPIAKYGGWMCNVPGYINCKRYAPFKNFWFSVWNWIGGRDGA